MPDRSGAHDVIDFADQAAVVTGAGRGLGRLYAIELARRGAQVVVNDIGGSMQGQGTDASVADEVVAQIVAAGGAAVASHTSVETPEGGEEIVQGALDAFGRLDVVVSNAGIYEMVPFDQLTPEQWRRMSAVHADGAFHLTQPAFRRMKAQGYGRFVMVTSNIAAFGQPDLAHYGAAKGAVLGLTHALANEGAPHGILANAVLPIGRTRMMTDSLDLIPQDPVVERLFAETTPERVVALVTYLASRSCTLNQHAFSAAAGRFARVFIGLAEGWMADPGHDPTAEDIAEHLEAVVATEPFTVPTTVADEIVGLMSRLGII